MCCNGSSAKGSGHVGNQDDDNSKTQNSGATTQQLDCPIEKQLPVPELLAYTFCFSTALITAGYAFRTQISDDSLLALDSTCLREGFLGIKMDNTYLDLNHFVDSFWPMVAILTAHLVISQATLRLGTTMLHHLTCAACTLALSCYLFSVKCTCMLLSLHFCCLLASCWICSPLTVWSLILLAFLRFSGAAFGNRELHNVLGLDARGAHLFYPVSGYLYCRFLSMGLCLCRPASRSKTTAAAVDGGGGGSLSAALHHLPASLHYSFYLPNFLGGPVVTMDEFVRQRRSPQPPRRMIIEQSLLRGCRLVLWLCVTLAIVHWLPTGAYLETLALRMVRSHEPISFAHVVFAMYSRGQLFMLEYVQYYGWPALFAGMDGIQLPHWPACICRVASYREMWRLFDRGLFAIVREHVYIPLGGSRRGLARQLGATAACFGFICLYHGNYDSVQAWILLNLGLVAAELIGVRVYRAGLETALVTRIGHRWLRRLTGLVAAANLIPPSVGIFYFFYGTYAGTMLIREVLWKPLTGHTSMASFAVFFACFYFSVQLAIEYKVRGLNKD